MADALPILVVEDNDEDFMPVDLERFEAMVRHFKDFWLEFVVLPPEPPREGPPR
jgi:hypothetical protein